MTTQTINTLTADAVLEKWQAELDELDERRTQAQRDVASHTARMSELRRRASAIQVATTTLASLPSLAPDQEWLDHLTAWRKTLCDELLKLPPRIRDPYTLGVQHDLTLSIAAIDRGLPPGTGYDLTNLRLGKLMRESGFEPTGADPDRNYRGLMPWFGTIQETEHRIHQLTKQRDEAQAVLDDALLDDDSRMRLTAELATERDRLNAMPQRKVRGDGSVFDLWPDGRRVEVTS